MKLFFIVFAAILAAAAVIFAVIGAKARLDQWEYALRMCYAETNSESAAMKARADAYMERAHSRAPFARDSSDVLAVTELGAAAVNETVKGQKRLLEIDRKVIALLENKPFGLPLTSAEQSALADANAAIETLTKPAPAPTSAPSLGFESDESMKPTSEASEAERERRRKAQQQIEIRRARPVDGREIVATPTSAKGDSQ